MSQDLDLKNLIGGDYVSTATDKVLDALLVSMNNFTNNTTVKGTGNIFDCAISLGDFNFDLNLDFFNIQPTKMDYILLKKIKYLRRLIIDINNIFINLIQDLECCTGDDRYNKTVVPIFKWLVEDKNGLCGTLLTIAKDINKIYMPLKRLLCLFRNIPGNPTWPVGGGDYLSAIYPIAEGLERVTNMLDNGRFLDLIIIPVKDFHDKLVACSSGSDTDFYTGYSSLKDIISDSIFTELTTNLIDEIKKVKSENLTVKSDAPTPPTPPEINYSQPTPKISNYPNYDDFSKAMYEWNKGYSEYKKSAERDYNSAYSNYLVELNKYKQKKFESTLSIKDEKFENSSFAVELNTDSFKTNHRAICGCLGEIFRLDGFFIPKSYIIRNESDLNGLVGQVEYKGVTSSNYYVDSDEKKIKIINKTNLNDIRSKDFETTFDETLKYPLVKDNYLEEIANCKTIQEVIDLNTKYNQKLQILQTDYRKLSNFYDSLGSTWYNVYLKEVEELRRKNALYTMGQLSEADWEIARKGIYEYSAFPPASWVTGTKTLPTEYENIFGSITYNEYTKGIDDLYNKINEIDDLKNAIGRNYASFSIVDETNIECGCNLLCMVIKYIIGLIMNVIKKLLAYITKFISQAVVNKELQWWIKFVTEKIRCIIDILNLSKDLEKMETEFNKEIKRGEGTIQKAPQSIANCTSTTKSVIDDINLYPAKAKVQPDSITDITWVPSTYPNWDDSYVDVTPTIDDSFKITSHGIGYEITDWKNRTIPTMVLDCSKDFSVSVNWVPTSNAWKAALNIQLNIDQFNSNNGIILQGSTATTEKDLVNNLYQSILYKLLAQAISTNPFKFKILVGTIETKFDTTTISTSLDSTNFISDGVIYPLEDINKVWFWVDAVDLNNKDISTYIKVFDKNASNDLETFKKNIMDQITETLQTLKKTEYQVDDIETTTSKLCGANSLSVSELVPVFDDEKSLLYPGKFIKTKNSNNENIFTYTPSSKVDEAGNTVRFSKNNTPFKLTLKNGSGREFIVILLIDVCLPNNVVKVSYSKDIDGVFLNGRYDYVDFEAIPNNADYIISEKDIIKRLRGYLENVGAISSMFTGPLGMNSVKQNTETIIDNTVNTLTYSAGFNTDQNTSVVNGNNIIANLPDGNIKNAMLLFEKISESLTSTLDEVETVESLTKSFDNGVVVINPLIENITKSTQYLGIPLMTLNEDSNIILTIHEKKLKLININSDFGLNLVLETGEIDYKSGEQLYVEFSTTGFEHTITWINERKITGTSTVMSMNSLELKPTQLGSFYKDGVKVALMCGKINDIIFTNSSHTSDEWYNNSNTYRPNGTIGYYDFSLFDGYHVYSIPEYFKVVKVNSLATVKGIMYESKNYTSTEIDQLIQEGNLNELLATNVTIVGEKPITVGGNFIWKNNVYYKNVSFGYLENFFCRENLVGSSFTISFWLKQKDAITNNREDFSKKYIFSDTNNGNFIWLEKDLLNIKLLHQPLRTEPVRLLFVKDTLSTEPVYVEKWFHHVFRYDKVNAEVHYDIQCIDRVINFDQNYGSHVLDPLSIKIPLNNVPGIGKVMNYSLVTMLARYDVKKLDYTDNFWGEIAALAIWNEFKSNEYLAKTYDYQRRIIINEMSN